MPALKISGNKKPMKDTQRANSQGGDKGRGEDSFTGEVSGVRSQGEVGQRGDRERSPGMVIRR